MEVDLRTFPPLSLLAAVAALAHLAVYRVLVPVLAVALPTTPRPLLTLAPFLLNLTACAGMVAWAFNTTSVVRCRTHWSHPERTTIAALSGVVLTTSCIATFAPLEHMPTRLVLVGAGAAHLVAVQLARGALQTRSTATRATALLLMTTAGLALAGLLARELQGSRSALLQLVHGIGEVAYLLMPCAAVFVVAPWTNDKHGRRARTVGAITAAAAGCAFAAAMRLPHTLYRHIVYSTWKLEWALERASLGYAVPISLSIGAAVAALASRSAAHRQGGIGIILWLAAGYNPLTPARLLLECLGVALLTRALIAAETCDLERSSSGLAGSAGGTYG